MKSYTQEALKGKFHQFGFKWPDFHLIGIRSKADVPNEFDDLFYAISGATMKEYKGTTNDGTFYLKNPLNPKGAALLVADKQYIDTYQIGQHHDQIAFVQIKAVTVHRDNNKDLKSDETKVLDTGFFGLNIHRYNKDYALKFIDKGSAGCQVFYDPKQFEEFKAAFIATKLKYLTYTLLHEY